MTSDSTDPPIDEIRAVRHRISKSVGHDPEKLVAHYMELQKRFRERLLNARKLPQKRERPAAS